MLNSDISGSAPKQDAVTTILNSRPQQLHAHDLQARRLGQRFALTPEMARTYADLAFNAGGRP
jgi:hypothetical protein